MRLKLCLVLLGGGLLLTRTVDAHHAFSAEFDSERPVELKGVVTMMEWTSPHAWIHIDVKNPDGTIAKWEIEGSLSQCPHPARLQQTVAWPGTEIRTWGLPMRRKIDRIERTDGPHLRRTARTAWFDRHRRSGRWEGRGGAKEAGSRVGQTAA